MLTLLKQSCASFLFASATAIIYPLQDNQWIPEQDTYRTAMLIFGITNAVMQFWFFVCCLLLEVGQSCLFSRHGFSTYGLETIKVMITMISFLWIALNMIAWVLAPIFFLEEWCIGSNFICQYSGFLYGYETTLLAIFIGLILVFVWPRCIVCR